MLGMLWPCALGLLVLLDTISGSSGEIVSRLLASLIGHHKVLQGESEMSGEVTSMTINEVVQNYWAARSENQYLKSLFGEAVRSNWVAGPESVKLAAQKCGELCFRTLRTVIPAIRGWPCSTKFSTSAT